ncbi:PAS domain-containing sensor histidine kinase [Dyadobacter crusticola]|uniref:PAS domain-containing sensor histidine kinase n=1 Tax=Dyadobacter crusticola TaxID=292407 RepID=UPI000689398D|nr:PAS domain-containing protein [Dyadobacter crusticola]
MEELSKTNANALSAGGGRMGEFIRSYNWSASALGTPDRWPVSLRTLVQMTLNSRFPTVLFWGKDLITFYNDAFHASFAGKEGLPVIGKPGPVSFNGSWNRIATQIATVMGGGEALWFEDEVFPLDLNKQADSSHWTYSISAVHDDSGAINGVLFTCLQTTRAVETANRLRFSEQRFQNLVREASVGIIMLSGPEMRVEIVNEAYASLINRKASQLQGQKLFDIVPEGRDPFYALINKVRLTGEPLYLYAQPYHVLLEEGRREGFLDLVYQPYRELDGQITGVIILCQDVTQQVSARRQLEESEARLRSVVESAPFPIGLYVGPEMRIQLVNQSIIDVWGKGPDIVGKRYAEVLPELAGKGIYEQLDGVYRTGKTFNASNQRVDLMIEGELRRFYFKYTFTPLFDSDRNVYGVMNTAADVTDLVLAQEQLQEAEASLRGAIELAQLGSWELDVATGKVSYSDTIKSWFGFDEDQIVLGEVYNPIHPDDRAAVADAVNRALASGSSGVYDAEYRLIAFGSDQERVVHALGKVIYDEHGQPYKMLGTAQDITSSRQRQDALEQLVQLRTAELAAQNEEYFAINEELEEANQLLLRTNENLQQFAYVASHDLQEPLRKIRQFSDLLKSQNATASGNDWHYLDRIQSAASRMSVLIRDLLDFSSITTELETAHFVSLDTVVNTVLSDLELVVIETGAQVEMDPLPGIQGNALQLGQLFQNLISNALKFRKPGTAPLIRVTSTQVAQSELPSAVKPVRNSRMYHRIEVTDNGIGFDEKYLDRIFQVFQRLHSKHEFNGTGIGLAICEKVVANHGGAITAASQPGQGASFQIFFPV